MIEILSTLFALAGTFFIVVASVGLLRMPDLFLRMSTTTKASTLGASFTLIAAAVFFQDFSVTTRCLATILFLFLTTPVAAHMIGRAGYLSGARLWEKTIIDELSGHYDREGHRLEGLPTETETDESHGRSDEAGGPA